MGWDGKRLTDLVNPGFFSPESTQTVDEPNFVKIKLILVALADPSKTDTYKIKTWLTIASIFTIIHDEDLPVCEQCHASLL